MTYSLSIVTKWPRVLFLIADGHMTASAKTECKSKFNTENNFVCGRLVTILFAVTFILRKLGIILLLFMNAIHLMSYKIMHLVGVDSLKISLTDILLVKSLLLVHRNLGLVLYLFINC